MRDDTPRSDATGSARGYVQDLTRLTYIPGLDGIRAVAILMVIVAHYGFGHIVPGGLGVTIFFFVSGFLITTLLLREQEAGGSVDLRNFYLRRILRLGPELVAFVLITGAVSAWQGYTVRPVELLAALFYFTNYYHLFQGMCIDTCADWHALWSLAVEEHFYLVFPLVLLFTGNAARLLLTILTAALVAGLLWRIVIVASGAFDPEWTYKASDARMDSIAYGCWLALVFARFPALLAQAQAYRFALAGAAVALMLLSLGVRDSFFRETFRYSLQGLSMGLAVTALYATSLGRPGIALLEWKPLAWIGRMSYGAYLWHFVPLAGIMMLSEHDRAHHLSLIEKFGLCIVGTAATLALAWLSYMLVARPVVHLRHRLRPRLPADARRVPVPAYGVPAAAEGRRPFEASAAPRRL